MRLSYDMKNYADLGGCYPPQPSASADNTLLDLHNSSYHTQPHPIIAKYRHGSWLGSLCTTSTGGDENTSIKVKSR